MLLLLFLGRLVLAALRILLFSLLLFCQLLLLLYPRVDDPSFTNLLTPINLIFLSHAFPLNIIVVSGNIRSALFE